METDFLNGEISLLGRLHGIPTPVNNLLQVISAEVASGQRAPGSVRLRDRVFRRTRQLLVPARKRGLLARVTPSTTNAGKLLAVT